MFSEASKILPKEEQDQFVAELNSLNVLYKGKIEPAVLVQVHLAMGIRLRSRASAGNA